MKIVYIHFYVEDAKIWRDWFVNVLGFEVVSDRILFPISTEKQRFDTCTEIVKSGSICFVLSSSLLHTSPMAEFLCYHPPGVADVAFAVENIENILTRAQLLGVEVLQPIQISERDGTYLKFCKIAAWGSLTHTLIEGVGSSPWGVGGDEGDKRVNSSYSSPSSPTPYSLLPTPLTSIDHIVLNVAAGYLDKAVAWYEKILNFQPQQMFNIQTEYSALHSRVMISQDGNVQIPINEPATYNSQIQEFLDFNQGAGIQHIALRSHNLIDAISLFRTRNLPFLAVPKTYYSQLVNRPGFPLYPDQIKVIAQQEILVDWQENTPSALLLQIFTQPIFREPTFFFEFIERRNLAQGFGEGNFRALFEAIEREQLKRGLG